MKSSNTDDLNTPAYLERVKRIVMENLRHVGGPPSVQMTGKFSPLEMLLTQIILDIPTMPIDAQMDDLNEDEDLILTDERRPRRLLDHLRQNDDEFSDSDDEGEGGRRDHARYRDKDSVESNGNHRFGIGGGILTSGPANTHGAGPSAHTTAVQILSSAHVQDMDIDSPPSTGNEGVGSGNEASSSGSGIAQTNEAAEVSKPASPVEVKSEEPDGTKEPVVEEMAIDESSKSGTS